MYIEKNIFFHIYPSVIYMDDLTELLHSIRISLKKELGSIRGYIYIHTWYDTYTIHELGEMGIGMPADIQNIVRKCFSLPDYMNDQSVYSFDMFFISDDREKVYKFTNYVLEGLYNIANKTLKFMQMSCFDKSVNLTYERNFFKEIIRIIDFISPEYANDLEKKFTELYR